MFRVAAIDIVAPVAALGLAVLAAGSAQAQQGYGAPQAANDWRGFYAGAHLGGGVGDANSANTSGLIGGAQAGVNFQSDQFVFGGEADASMSSIDHKSFLTKYRQKWLASLRGRAGVALERTLIYGTLGVGFSGNEYKDAAGKSSSSQPGLVAGAGAEFKMAPNLSLRGEFLHYNFSNARHPSVVGPVEISPTANVLRGGVNVRF